MNAVTEKDIQNLLEGLSLEITVRRPDTIEEDDLFVPPEDFPKPDWSGKSFKSIAAEMDKIDNHVYKKILKRGSSIKIAPEVEILVNYELYFENEDFPFDSTRLRQKPQRVKLEDGVLVEGLEIAMGSMCLQEHSMFLIQWPAAYGELGCPPRIKPKSDILAIIEICKVAPSKFKEVTFGPCMMEAERLLKTGKQLYLQMSSRNKIIHSFTTAMKVLENCQCNSDEEQAEMEKLKTRIHANLSGIYNNFNRPEMAINHAREALKYDPNCKHALLQIGIAHIKFKNNREALFYLKKGHKLYPNDENFVIQLQKLNNN